MVKIPVAKMIKLSECKVHPTNVKEHPEKQIKNLMQLIEWVGFKDPIVLDKTNTVRAGHGRLIAAERLGMKEIPYVLLEGLTKAQMDLFIFMDNQINESPWIKENVQLILKDIPKKDLEMFDLNWDGVRDPNIKDETQPIPEPPPEPKSKFGDIYQLGEHRVMCGDSTNAEQMKQLCNIPITISFTSPPYNLGKNSKVTNPDLDSKYNEYDDDNPDYLKLLIDFTELALSNSQYVFVNMQQLAGNKINFIDYIYHFKNNFVDTIIWDKLSSAPARAKNVLNSEFEFILIFSPKDKPTRSITTKSFHGTIQNIYHGPLNSHNEFADIHRAVFPIHLPQFIVHNFTNPKNIILDPFLGTGSTLIAAHQTERVCFGMELDPAYVDVIIQRWENFTGYQAKLVESCIIEHN